MSSIDWPVAQMDDARARLFVGLRHREERARAEATEGRFVQKAHGQLICAGYISYQLSIALRVQLVGRECREPAREVVAASGCFRLTYIDVVPTQQNDLPQRLLRFTHRAKRGQVERVRKRRGEQGFEVRGARSAVTRGSERYGVHSAGRGFLQHAARELQTLKR
jgi:hypothetical protein